MRHITSFWSRGTSCMTVAPRKLLSSIIILAAGMPTPASHRSTETVRIRPARSFNLAADEGDFEGLLRVAPGSRLKRGTGKLQRRKGPPPEHSRGRVWQKLRQTSTSSLKSLRTRTPTSQGFHREECPRWIICGQANL